jgi:hypothetical protein
MTFSMAAGTNGFATGSFLPTPLSVDVEVDVVADGGVVVELPQPAAMVTRIESEIVNSCRIMVSKFRCRSARRL